MQTISDPKQEGTYADGILSMLLRHSLRAKYFQIRKNKNKRTEQYTLKIKQVEHGPDRHIALVNQADK